MKPAVVSLGEIHGGTASNVIPEEVYLHGTLRSFDDEVREQLVAEVEQALSVVRPLGGDFRLQVSRGYPAGWNDSGVAGWLKTASADLLGPDSIKGDSLGMGAEDFAYMCQVVPGAMIMVGAAPADGLPRYHHTSTFDIDERVLAAGAAILAETVVRFLDGRFVLS
jgi:metal-dependent amidase/aminoacylase/carboxypeptidase family protein